MLLREHPSNESQILWMARQKDATFPLSCAVIVSLLEYKDSITHCHPYCVDTVLTVKSSIDSVID
jgi:hypothetical protein